MKLDSKYAAGPVERDPYDSGDLSRISLYGPESLFPEIRFLLGTVFAAVAVVFLQVVLSAYFWTADPAIRAALTPTWDLLAIVLLLAAWAAVGPRRRWADRLVVIVITAIIFLYFLMGLGQGFALREFGYDVILRLHVAYVPELFRMMYNTEPLGRFILAMAALASGTVLLVLLIWASVRHLHVYARRGRGRQVILAGGTATAFVIGMRLLGVRAPITGEAYRQLDLAINLNTRISMTARRLELEAASESLWKKNPFLKSPGKPTILVFVVESYGEVLFSDPEFAGFPGWLEQEAKNLTGGGYTVASKQLTSTVFGGSSWLAGSSLLCGLPINNQKRFKGLFASQVRCLPAMLNEAGYRTVISAANATVLEDSYAHLLPFDRFYFRDDFGYRGPRMGWSYMPDQFTIDFLHRREIAPRLTSGGAALASGAAAPGAAAPGAAAREPLFAVYFLSTSHHPWSIIPPFVPDWSQIGDGSIYRKLNVTRFRSNQFITGDQYKKAYQASVEYSLHSVMAYLALLPPEDRSTIIILGDHQPRRPVAGLKQDPWTVPVHLLSRDRAAVARFVRVGYRPGIVPGTTPKERPSGLDRFAAELFSAYTDEAARP